MKHQYYTFCFFLFLLVTTSCTQGLRRKGPINLMVSENFINPIGFYDNSPTFSWQLPEEVQKQSAYSVVVASSPDLLPHRADLWKSGKIEETQSQYIKYEGKELSSGQEVFWQVKYWDENSKASKWSETAFFELGMLNNEDWQAKWIHIPFDQLTEKDTHGSVLFRPQYFRNEIQVGTNVTKARLYITAKGTYEAYLNGEKVGVDIMPPGWTPSNKTISTLTYDVTNMLRPGKNTIGAIVAEGWHSGRINHRKTKKSTANTPQLLVQLEIEDENGTKIFISDERWKVSNNGPIRSSKIYDGEIYDANLDLGDWNKNDYNDSDWFMVCTQEIVDTVHLLPKRYAGVTNKQWIGAINVNQTDKDKALFDFGQNNVGVPHLKVPMQKGDTLVVRFSEMLNNEGTIYTDNYRSALSTDYYVASENGIIDWHPTFTFHGYRYIELSGFDKTAKPQKEWVDAIVRYSDFEWNGTFSSSHEKLNKLQNNIVWSLRSNFYDIPTDCPQRDERLGWTGDAQVIVPAAMFNANMYSFWAGWLQSMRYEQFPNGGIPHVIPNCLGTRVSAGWADACVIIPWELYYRTGDISVLEENYDMMTSWIGYYKTKAKNYIVKMFAFSDWLQPYTTEKENPKLTRRGDTPPDFISTAYYARSVELTIKTAMVLGKRHDVKSLKLLHDSIKIAFENKFFDAEGRTKCKIETQTQYLLALEFDLLSETNRDKAIKHLVRVINDCDNHLRTGFLGTPVLPLVLDNVGYTDLMYEILFKETYPSWFYSINQGATTMWERWDSYTHEKGFHKDGMNSFNHYAYGAIGQWMYERIAGIKPLSAGYKNIEIAPSPRYPLTSAEAKYQSPYGNICSEWIINYNKFYLEVTIPPNTEAIVVVPGNTNKAVLLNNQPYTENEDVLLKYKTKNKFIFKVAAGNYHFESEMKY